MEKQPISFPRWKEAWFRVQFPEAVRVRYKRAILTYLHRWRSRHSPASVKGIRIAQEQLGHAGVETTQIYTHVMRKPGLGVKSPLDQANPGNL